MIKRTAQEWADFTGEMLEVWEEGLSSENGLTIPCEYTQEGGDLKINKIYAPSEPCVLIPARLLEEAGELIQRMNSALDGKIKEREDKCPHCGAIPLRREPSSNYSNTKIIFAVCTSCKNRV